MSDASQAVQESAKAESVKKFSPFAGCSIFIIAGALAAGMIAFTIWTYFKVQDTIVSFTGETPKAIELVELKDQEAAQTSLKAELVAFRHSIEAKNEGELSLTADEMNLAIATFDILKPHRKNLWIKSISNNQIEANISYPVKSSMGSDEMRYINGSAIIKPELVGSAVFPRVVEVKPDAGGDLPEEFKKFISETILHPLREDKELGPLFKRVSAVEIKGDALVLSTSPDYVAPDAPPEDRQPILNRFMKGFAIMAVIFLAIVSFIIILSRRKAKQSKQS